MVAEIYRDPNGTDNHVINDLETVFNRIDEKMTTVIVGDININIIKCENDNSVDYLRTVLSSLPAAYHLANENCGIFCYIDHIFIKLRSNRISKLDGMAYGILYCDISVFETRVRRKFETCFPVVQVSRKRLKDEACMTKGLKISIRTKHRLYRSTLRETDQRYIIKSKTYKNEFRKCLKAAEERYYHQLFDDIKSSVYNSWKNLGPVKNPKKIKRNQSISKLCCDDN